MSLAILNRLTATVLRPPDSSTMASLAASASNLFGLGANGSLVIFLTCSGEALVEALLGVEAGAYRGAALGQQIESRKAILDAIDAVAHLGGVAENSWPKVTGVASWVWVRPILMMPSQEAAFFSNALAR
jgi:hypothetical protein